jgi:hypothetical protein
MSTKGWLAGKYLEGKVPDVRRLSGSRLCESMKCDRDCQFGMARAYQMSHTPYV